MDENIDQTPEQQQQGENVAQPEAVSQPVSQDPADIPKDIRNWGMFCHLAGFARLIPIPFSGIIAPLVIWLMKKDEHDFIDRCGKAALNFQISVAIYTVASFLFFLLLPPLIILAVIAIAVFSVICIIIASIQANDGKYYEYPL